MALGEAFLSTQGERGFRGRPTREHLARVPSYDKKRSEESRPRSSRICED
jgi:hypothetical protein